MTDQDPAVLAARKIAEYLEQSWMRHTGRKVRGIIRTAYADQTVKMDDARLMVEVLICLVHQAAINHTADDWHDCSVPICTKCKDILNGKKFDIVSYLNDARVHFNNLLSKNATQIAAQQKEIKRLKESLKEHQEALGNATNIYLDKKEAEVAAANKEIERLRTFVEWSLEEYLGDDYTEPCGGCIQEKAEELKLIELRPCKPEDSIDGETEHYFCVWTPKEGSGDD
ncbi:hypothetical protein KAR91_30535 [Candidatus Pacearchaeota archaeon]|nr:hypothetical protein [Candidatus Pacearchaeota archaeon]